MLDGLSHLFASRPVADVLRDLIDILVISLLVYRALLVLKGTRAMQMGLGIIVFGALYFVARYAGLTTVTSLLSWLASSALLIIVVVFQNDIRRALIRLGAKAWLSRGRDAQERVIDEVVAAATELARHRMGAIICLERDANVLEFVKSEGVELDCEVSRELLVSLFIPEGVNKLHDGAVLIRDLRIACAGVFLPMPEVTKVADTSLGSRHRAAIGITEETDAVVVVVSEERGTVTLCFPNGMVQNVDGSSLKQALLGLFGRTAPAERPASDQRTTPERDATGGQHRSGKHHALERPAARSGSPEPERPAELRASESRTHPTQLQTPSISSRVLPVTRTLVPAPKRLELMNHTARALDLLDEDEPPASRLSVSKPMEPTEFRVPIDDHDSTDRTPDDVAPVTKNSITTTVPAVRDEP